MSNIDTTMSVIGAHIKTSEVPTEYPYLDIKGHVTIGAEFKIDNGCYGR